MRIVVTGAAGFVGSHLCEALVARGHDVVGIDGFTRFYARALKERNVAALRRAPRFTLHERNLLDRAGLADVLAGAGAVRHLAGRPGVRGGAPVLFEAGNGRTTEAVMHSAARAGVPRVLLASSSSVYAAAGPRQRPDMAFARFIHAALAGGEMPLLGDGRQQRDFTYVGDAVEGTALALERGRSGAAYNIAGGRQVAARPADAR